MYLVAMNPTSRTLLLSAWEKAREAEPAIAAARRKHSGAESAVDNLENRGLDRVRLSGLDGFELAASLSVLALYIHRLGMILRDKERKRMQRAKMSRERGLPVGSGVVESAFKQIVGSRFKRSGCRWSKAGANVLLAAECCIENNRWTDFFNWKTCLAVSHQRN